MADIEGVNRDPDYGQKAVQEKTDKIQALGYVPLTTDLDELPSPKSETSTGGKK